MSEFKSGAFHFRDFLQSVVWADMKQEMENMRQSVRDNLETVEELAEFYRFQGRAEVLRDLQVLPEAILAALEDEGEKAADDDESFNLEED